MRVWGGGAMPGRMCSACNIRQQHVRTCPLHALVRACRYMHALRVLHVDLKSENVLLCRAHAAAAFPPAPPSAARRGDVMAKVADFGLCRVMPLECDVLLYGIHGTVSHMPPEAMRETQFSFATDVFSFGVVSGGGRGRWLAVCECPAGGGCAGMRYSIMRVMASLLLATRQQPHHWFVAAGCSCGLLRCGCWAFSAPCHLQLPPYPALPLPIPQSPAPPTLHRPPCPPAPRCCGSW